MATIKKTTTTTVVTEVIDDTEKKSFHAMVLIDNSGSMSGWQQRVASGVNEYVSALAETAKKDGFKATVTVCMFDSDMMGHLRMSYLRTDVDPAEWSNIEPTQIIPVGGTPLYDAVHDAIVSLNRKTGVDKALVVITDGYENASRRSASYVKEIIQSFQNAGNLMIYLGANQDAWAVGGSMGTSRATTATYGMNNIGQAFLAASSATVRYSQTRNVNSGQFTEAELSAMTEDKNSK